MVKTKCPYCLSENLKVVETRESNIDTTRRRRECLSCGKRFTTYERIELEDLTVIKRDGRREKFDRNKVVNGIKKACEKRPVSTERIEKLVDEVETALRQKGPEVSSKLIGKLVMEKLRELDEVAYIRFASIYKRFKDLDSFKREIERIRVIGEARPRDTTEIQLMVSTASKDMVSRWDRRKIVKALMKEVRLKKSEAESIAEAVEKKVLASGIKNISVSLLRELVNNELFERGYKRKLENQEIIGMSVYNLEQMIFRKGNENANIISNNPEAVNLAIAEDSLKKYALKRVFSRDVADAHLTGMIHIHDLGYPIRVYCSAHSLEYIKKYGLRLLNLSTVSKPAKHAETLVGHLNTFLASMQAYYAGALGIGYVNIFFAPYLVGKSKEEVKQLAQYLIFSCSQNAFSRGGQTLFIDFNVHLGVPEYMKRVPAIGPGGKYMIKKGKKVEFVDEVPRDEDGYAAEIPDGKILTYADFEKEAQLFARCLMEVWREGDARGMPFPFPKFNLHINEDVFRDPKQYELFRYACEIAAENGATYFVFDREEVNLSMCCRLRTTIKDNYMITHPESMRFCGFQNVTINLPQAAYRSGRPGHGSVERVVKEIYRAMEIAMKAHLQKREFIRKLMVPGGPLWQVGMKAMDGRPYIDLDECTYIIGLIGLNECVKYITGMELHESEEAYRTGLKIISAMYLKVKEFEKRYGLKVSLEETPAESTSMRLARTDLLHYPESENYVRGDKKTGEVYYTNSIHFRPDAPIDIIERIEKQGKFNVLIESGAITHVFLGEQKPDPEAVENLVKRTWYLTQSAQIVISPEFTVCDDCGRVSRGYARKVEAR